jgi:hypothetical protein
MISSRIHRTKGDRVLKLAQQTMSNSHRITLERIAETWYRIADSLPANDANIFNGQFKGRSSRMALAKASLA